MTKQLYTPEYADQLKQVHKKAKWGGSVKGKVSDTLFYMKMLGLNEVLDYGCGYGCFREMARNDHKSSIIIHEYDPGIIGKTDPPEPCEFVLCVDVLEHIEPEFVDNVLDDLQRVVLNIGFFGIALNESKENLPNGKNAHLSVHPIEWWKPKIEKRFDIIRTSYNDIYYKLIVKRKKV